MGSRGHSIAILLSVVLLSGVVFASQDVFAIFSGSNGVIVMEKGGGSNWEVWYMNSDGTGETQLTNQGAGVTGRPSIGPDGDSVAFNDGGNIWMQKISGGSATQLTTGSSQGEPTWDSTGNKIAFHQGFGNAADLYMIDMSSGTAPFTATALTVANSATKDEVPNWCSQNNQIVFNSKGDNLGTNADGEDEVFVLDLDVGASGTLYQVTNNADSEAHASFSADCTKIIYSSNRGGNADVYVMDWNPSTHVASNEVRLTTNAAQDRFPVFSPNGDYFIFQVDNGRGTTLPQIFRGDFDGSTAENNIVKVSTAPEHRFPDWNFSNDVTAPVGDVTHSLAASTKVKAGASVDFTVSFNEAMSRLDPVKLEVSEPGSSPTLLTLNRDSATSYSTSSPHTIIGTGDGAITFTVISDSDLAGNSATTGTTESLILDNTPPEFSIQYYYNSILTTSAGDNPHLGPANGTPLGTYYLAVFANEALAGTPVVDIDAEGTANDVAGGATTGASSPFVYTRTIVFDAAAVGATLEDISITMSDLAGNVATFANPTNEATKAAYTDAVAPLAPATPDLDPLSDTYAGGIIGSDTDNLTKEKKPEFFGAPGSVEGNAIVVVYSDVDGYLGGTTAAGDGSWSKTSESDLTEGPHSITVTATDAAFNTSPASTGLAMVLDITPPGAPSAPDLTAVQDLGKSSTDDITSLGQTGLTFSGTSDPDTLDTLIEIFSTASQSQPVGSGAGVAPAGNWLSGTSPLDEGTYDYTAENIDAAGNRGPASTATTVETDYTAPSVTTTNSDPENLISEADTGAGKTFTVIATFDDDMDTTVDPVVTFSGPSIGSTLGGPPPVPNAILSGWISSTVYETVYDVSDDDIMVTGVVAKVSGAKDVAGNAQNVDATGTTFAVDTEMPSVGTATVETSTSDTLLTDADLGAGGFTVTATFSESMDTAFPPTISFTPDVDITAPITLTKTGGVWSMTTYTDDTYTATYTVLDGNVEFLASGVGSVTASTSGGKDLAGNMQKPDTVPGAMNPFEIDTKNPTVTTTNSDPENLISEADTGVGKTFTVIATFDEPMDQTGPNTPVITFTGPSIGSTLGGPPPVPTGASGWQSSTVYHAVYDVSDDDIMVTGVVAKVSNAKDVALNPQNVDAAGTTFAVDTEMPSVGTATVETATSDTLLSDADVGTGTFTVTATFSESMDTAFPPTISFTPDVDITAPITLTKTGGVWSMTTYTDDTYTATYDVADADVEFLASGVGSVTAKTSGGKDLAGNMQKPDTVPGAMNPFEIDTRNPNIVSGSTLSITSNNVVDAENRFDTATTGTVVTVRLHADEPLMDPDFFTSGLPQGVPDSTDLTDVNLDADGDDLTDGIPEDANSDVRLSTTGDPDGIDNTVIILQRTIQSADEEGNIAFSIDYYDLAGNQGDPDNDDLPESATNDHLTDNTQRVILDTTAPTGSVLILGEDVGNVRTFERLVDLTLTCNDELVETGTPTPVSNNESGCYDVKISDTGDELDLSAFQLLTDADSDTAGLVETKTDISTLTSERGQKFVLVQYRDRAGNTNTDVQPTAGASRANDDIQLDPFFSDVVITSSNPLNLAGNAEGEWEDVLFDVSGKITHPLVTGGLDKVRVDFDYDALIGTETFDYPLPGGYQHPSNIVIEVLTPTVDPDVYTFVTSGGDESLSREYPRPSRDQVDIDNVFSHLHIPEVTLLLNDESAPVDESVTPNGETDDLNVDAETSNQAEVLERKTTVNLNVIPDTFINTRFGVTGGQSPGLTATATPGLIEDVDATGIPGKLIEFDGSGAPEGIAPFEDLTDVLSHDGLTIRDDEGIVVGGDGIIHLKPATDSAGTGAIIETPHLPGFISFTIDDTETNLIALEVTDGLSNVTPEELRSDSSGAVTIPITDTEGIAKVEVKEIFSDTTPPVSLSGQGKTLALSKLETRGFELEVINALTFSPGSFNSKTYDVGFFFSEANSTTTKGDNLLVDAKFTDTTDPDYLPSSSDLGFVDTVTVNGMLDLNEAIYDDVDQSGDVSIGDRRILNTGSDGTRVISGEGDIGTTLTFDVLGTLPPANEKRYSVATAGTGGYDNTGTATIIEDNNKGIAAKQCAPGDDTDGDAICDSWEMNGIPYKFNGLTFLMPLDLPCPSCTGTNVATPGPDGILGNGDDRTANLITVDADGNPLEIANDLTPTVGVRDIYIEIDAMDLHPPDVIALNDVIKLYADATDSPSATGPIALHLFLDQGRDIFATDGFAHKDTIKVWKEGLRFFDNNYNGLKAENFGTRDLISPFLTKDEVVKVEVVDAEAGEYNILITGYEITTPFDTRTTPTADRTKGLIQNRVILTGSTGDGLTIGNSEFSTFTQTPLNAGLTNFDTPRLKSINALGNGKKIIAFDQPYFAKAKLTDFSLGTYTIPVTLDNPAGAPLGCVNDNVLHPAGSFCSNGRVLGEFPKIDSRLRNDAYAQVYRYAMFVHSFGGPSGEAELRGNDMVIALGSGFGEAFNGHPGGTRHQQSGTFAHELLHLLNGMHGGPQYLITDPTQTKLNDTPKNCKPFPGVDKYQNQLPNIYLDLALVDPMDPRSDVDLANSEWNLGYSDGSHGYSILEFALDGTTGHIADLQALGGTLGGLDESLLVEDRTAGMPGTPYTMVWATPGSNHANPHSYHKHISDSSGPTGTDFNLPLQNGDIDWNDNQTIDAGTVSADINNFGIAGCVAGDDAEYYDYDAFFHMDFDFRQGPGGAFDGIQVFVNDPSGNDIWKSVATTATFDGLDPEDVQSGEKVVIAGTTHPVVIQLQALQESEGTPADPLYLDDVALAQVWVSKNPDAVGEGVLGIDDPTTSWIQISDENPDPGDDATFMRWDQSSQSLVMDWDTPNRGSEIGLPDNDSITGDWYIRVVLSDNPLDADAEGILSCDVNIEELVTGSQTACLFGDKDDADSNFLIDPVVPHMDDDGEGNDPGAADEQLKATGKVILKLPKPMKTEEDLIKLQELKDDAVDNNSRWTLGWAIGKFQDSLNDDYWVDQVRLQAQYGDTVLFKESQVVGALEDISKGNWPYNGESQDVKDRAKELAEEIAEIDKVLAETAMEDAAEFASTQPLWYDFWFETGQQELLDAQADFDNEKFEKAVFDYEDAWLAAFRAMFNEIDDDGIEGNAGNNWIYGSHFVNDDLSGLEGKDRLFGRSGDDELFGGPDRDSLYGYSGADYLTGDDYFDWMFAGWDKDWLRGGQGNDKMYGENGDDLMFGEEGDDRMLGGWDDDVMYGGADDDDMFGQYGDDVMFGEAGNDYLDGWKQNDFMDGGAGNDYMTSGSGVDILISGPGTDTLYAGSSSDVLVGSNEGDYLHCGSGSNNFAFTDTDTTKKCENVISLDDLTIAPQDEDGNGPAGASIGDYWIDTTSKSLNVWDGSAWNAVIVL